MDLSTKISISETTLKEEIDGEIILLNIKTQEYFSLSDVGKIIWEQLLKNQNLNQVLNHLIQTYNVEPLQLKNDLINFLIELNKKELITRQ